MLTRPDWPDSAVALVPAPGQSAWPATVSPAAQPWFTQQPRSWASLFGCASATALINGATAAGGRPRAPAISFGVRPRCRSSRTRSINSGFVIVVIVSRTVVRDKDNGGNRMRPDAGAG